MARIEWLKEYGALLLLAGGASFFVVILALDVLAGLSLPYPFSLLWLVIAGMPAAGIAILFRQALDEHDHAQDDRWDGEL